MSTATGAAAKLCMAHGLAHIPSMRGTMCLCVLMHARMYVALVWCDVVCGLCSMAWW